MIVQNAVVRTMDPAHKVADSVTITGNRVTGVGSPATPGEDAIDARGLCVMPGFCDSHVHFATWALGLRQTHLEGAKSLDEALSRIAAAEPRRSGWICGLGWSHVDWTPPVAPTKQALDAVTGDRPAALMSKDYHSLWVNSAALARADGDLERPGGVVERDAAGEPTGILREEAAWQFRDTYVRPTHVEMVAASRPAIELANARGVTAVHDKDGWLDVMPVWRDIHRDGGLSLRVWQSYPPDALDDLNRLRVDDGPPVRLGYIKVFMDGTLGSRTALMLDGSGVEITSEDALVEIILRAAEADLAVGVHAIGDLANRRALNAFEATQDAWAGRGLRPRIEHAQLLAPDDIGRFAELGVTASVQFSHAPADRDVADNVWGNTDSTAYAFRSLAESGAILANGSDAPVEDLEPLRGIRAAVRRTYDERAPWHPEEALSTAEALVATTVHPAWLAHADRERGRIREGFLADLVVLSSDPFATTPEELDRVEVVATMFDGRWVHNPPPW